MLELKSAHDVHMLLGTAEEEQRTVVLDFAQRNGCVPCKRLEPHYRAVAKNFADVRFAVVYLDEVDRDDFEELVTDFNVSATPTVVMFGYKRTELKERTAPKLIDEITVNL